MLALLCEIAFIGYLYSLSSGFLVVSVEEEEEEEGEEASTVLGGPSKEEGGKGAEMINGRFPRGKKRRRRRRGCGRGEGSHQEKKEEWNNANCTTSHSPLSLGLTRKVYSTGNTYTASPSNRRSPCRH